MALADRRCPTCGRRRYDYGYLLAGEPVCRGCWLDAETDVLDEVVRDG